MALHLKRFRSGFLSLLWSMLNDMSSLTLLALISVPVPGSVQPYLEVIMNFVYLDIFFTDYWFQPILDFDDDNSQAISPYFD